MSRIVRKTFDDPSFRVRSEDKGEVSAAIARTDRPDRDGDLFIPGSFEPTRVQLSAWGHSLVTENHPPVGVGTIEERGDEAVFVGKYFMDVAAGREAFTLTKNLGADARWSFGFARSDATTRSPTSEERARGARNVYTRVKAMEVSPVLNPSQPLTGTLSVKDSGEVDLAAAQSLVSLKAIMAEGELSHADVADAMEIEVDEFREVLRGERPLPDLAGLKCVREPLETKRTPEEIQADYRRHRVEFEREFGPTEARVSPDERRAAENLVRWAAARSGLRTTPVVKFYAPSDTSPPWRGLYDPRTRVVWLRKGLGRSDLLKASFHELRHFARHVQGLDWKDETAVATETDRLLNIFALESSPTWQMRKRTDLFEKLSTS